MTPKRIRQAAWVLRLEARHLRNSHINNDGVWDVDTDPLQEDCRELLSLSRELYALARKTATPC